MLGVQTFVLVMVYINSLSVIPGYGSRAECDASARIIVAEMRSAGGRIAPATFCVPGPVELR